MNVKSHSIVNSYLVLTGLHTLSASLIWGVNTLFLLNAGLNIAQVFIVNASYTAAMAVFEIPTGILADTRGRRISYLLSIVFLLVGTLGYIGAARAGGGLALFILTSIIIGIGFTFYSGAVEAWLVDALKATGYIGELDDIFAQGAFVSSVAMLIGTVSGGILGTVDLTLPYLLRCVLLVIVFVVAFLTMKEIGFTPTKPSLAELPSELRKIARASVSYGWGQPSMRLLVITTFIQSIFFTWGFYAWQPYFLQLLGQNAPWVAGVVSALISLATMSGNYLVKKRANRQGRRTSLLLIAAIVSTCAAVGTGLAHSFILAVVFYLISSVARGIWVPVKQAYMHQLIPSAQRATVISFDSLVDSAGSVIGQAGLGQVSEQYSIGTGYVLGGLITVLNWPVIWLLRRRQDDEDFIVGEAGKKSACGAQGVPSISGVDSQAGLCLRGD